MKGYMMSRLIISSNNFTDLYASLFADLNANHDFMSAPRGQKVVEKLGVQFELTNPLDRLPLVPQRNWSLAYWIAEMVWYLSGNNSTEWISHYAPFWNSISDDGKTANSAYGHRVFTADNLAIHDQKTVEQGCGETQWEYVINELRNDPDSRRAVIHIRTPWDSFNAKKDVPCTLSLQFFIRDGMLHQVATMRSTDLVLGLAYDVPAFTFFQELLALELGVNLGKYIHCSGSLHVYERHHEMMRQVSSLRVPDHSGCSMTHLPSRHQNVRQIMHGLNSLHGLCAKGSIDSAFDWVSVMNENIVDVEKHGGDGTSLRYWHDWFAIMLGHWLKKAKDDTRLAQVHSQVRLKGFRQALGLASP